MTNSVLSRSPSQVATSSIASNTIRSGVEMAKGETQPAAIEKTDSQNTVQNGSPKPTSPIDLLKPPTPPKSAEAKPKPNQKPKLNGGDMNVKPKPALSPSPSPSPSATSSKPVENGNAKSTQKPPVAQTTKTSSPPKTVSEAKSKSKSTWHVNPKEDVEVRRVIIKKIVQLLDGCRPKAFAGQPKKLMNLARRLEVALYKASHSKNEYLDLNTLRSRVVNLVKQSNAAQGSANSPRANSRANGHAKGRPSPTEQQRRELLRQRQQRLLLLRHASQCKVSADDQCKITPHCAAMKKLWHHISKCKDEQCTVQHCVSSRFVLSHYHRCKEPRCPVCKPVRLISQKRQREASSPAKVEASGQPSQKKQKVDKVKEKPVQKPKPVIRRPPAAQAKAKAHAQALRALNARDRMLVRKSSMKVRGMSLRINPRFARSCKSGTGPSLPLSLTKTALVAHLKSLKVERLQACLAPLLRKLMESKHNRGVFNEPVDPVALNIPEYPSIVTEPMDLGTIRQKLEDGKYCKLEEFEREVKLTFNNAIKFNPTEHPVNQLAQILLKMYESDIPRVLAKMKKEIKRRHDKCQLCFQNQCEVCPLCERGCIAHEPKIIYCSGPCANRIGRNSNFYVVPGSSYYWCTDCFDKTKKETVESNGRVYKKADMEKKRNNELFAEPWVSCDKCNRWVHQVCALFNMRKNNPNSNTSYTCPACLIVCAKDVPTPPLAIKDSPKPLQNQNNHGVKREHGLPGKGMAESVTLPLDKHVPDASDLEHTRLGLFLETWIRERYGSARQDMINNPPPIQGDVGPDPSKLHIRVLSNFDENCKVKPFVKKAMESYPAAFKFRSRCLFLFQELDGVNVLIYAMFVQEYGSDCPDPNRRKLYIAYLDSVHYFRPRKLRTQIYHELLLAYLEYSRRSGFTSAYIWACPPPNKRDDYIIHCHPEHQRVPSADRLRKWYHDMITRGRDTQIILGHCSLFEEHFESTGSASSSSKRNKKVKKKEKKKGKKGKKKSSKKAAASRGSSMTPPLEDDKDKEEELLKSLPAVPGGPKADPAKPPTDKNVFTPVGRGLLTSDGRNRAVDLEKRKSQKLAKLGYLPYFEGDYWPQEAEELGREQEAKLRAKKEKAESSRSGRKRQRMEKDGEAKSKTKNAKPKDAPTAAASKPKEELDMKAAKELLIVRLSEQLEAMKDDFLVVKLAHECTRCGTYLLRGRWECRHKDCKQSPTTSCVFALCNSCYKLERERPVEQQHGGGCIGNGDEFMPKSDEEEEKKEKGLDQKSPHGAIETPKKEEKKKAEEKVKELKEEKKVKAEEVEKSDSKEGSTKRPLEKAEEAKESAVKKQKSESGGAVAKKPEAKVVASPSPKEKLAAEEAKKKEEEARRKKELEGKVAEWKKVPLGCTRIVPETTDDHTLHYVDENLPVNTPQFDRLYKNQLVETRHSFLSLCTGNKYQFDQLRRAKHSTMMVLYHLHNPDAPAHLYTCNECRADILGGQRFHCDICQSGNFDLCEKCVTRVKHIHRLTAFVVTGGVNTSGPEAKRMKQRVTEMRRARKHSLHLFLEALVHASSCDDRECDTAPCRKMKDLLKHRLNCQVRVRGGCEVCRRVLCLVQMHARNCRLPNCRVPHCDDLKAHLAQQQMLHARQVARRESLQGRSRGRARARGARRGRGRVSIAQQSMKATVVAGSGGTRLKIKATIGPSTKKNKGGRGTRGGRGARARGRGRKSSSVQGSS